MGEPEPQKRPKKPPSEKQLAALESARAARSQIKIRLDDEGEDELFALLDKCGQSLLLVCTNCGHHHPVETKCKQKWCPCCARAIAVKRSMKYQKAIKEMEWPLFITLTMKNVDDLKFDAVKLLRRAFGKLRHRKLWKNNVVGGVAAIEVTNIGNGWHPHLHAVIDCRWLAVTTPRPQPGESKASVKNKCEEAQKELSKLWAKCLGANEAVVWVKRAKGETIAQEVLKYSVKGSDLLECADKIGPLIHCLRASRLVTSFGTLFGKLRVEDDEKKPASPCEDCGASGSFVPQDVADKMMQLTRYKK